MIESNPRPDPAIAPAGWQAGLAPPLIGLFLWAGFFDGLGRRALPVGGLGWSILGAGAAALCGYLLLYRGPALWGHRAGLGWHDLAARALGRAGADVLGGSALLLGQVAIFALAVGLAIDWTFDGLIVARMVGPAQVGGASPGGGPPTALYAVTAGVWAVATALVGAYFVRWVGALMLAFPIFPAALLGAAMMATLGGLGDFAPTGIDPADGSIATIAASGWRAFGIAFQWVFAFSALPGLLASDWGRATTTPRDVRIGGWAGMAMAPAAIAALALIAVAGHEGKVGRPGPPPVRLVPRFTPAAPPSGSTLGGRPLGLTPVVDPSFTPPTSAAIATDRPGAFTFRKILAGTFDRRIAGGMLMTFGLASLAPAVFASWSAATTLGRIRPWLGRPVGAVIVAAAGLASTLLGWQRRPEAWFDALGAVFAPLAGVLAVAAILDRRSIVDPRRPIRVGGVLAWALGIAAGFGPTLARAFASHRLDHVGPPALWAFGVAAVASGLAAIPGLIRRPRPG